MYVICLSPCVLYQSDDVGRVAKAAKIMERMVNQNTYDDISQGQLQYLYMYNEYMYITIHSVDNKH